MLRYQIFRKAIKINSQLRNEIQIKSGKNSCLGRSINVAYSTDRMAYNSYEGTITENNGPPVIIMHGLFGSKQNWRSISKAIQAKTIPHRKVIAVDARNHGESPHSSFHSYGDLADDIAKFYREHNIERAAVIGHSMGGRAMMYFALKYPELVERAIIVDISPVNTSVNLLKIETVFEAMKTINVPPELSMKDGRQMVEMHLKQTIPDKETIDFILLNLKKAENGNFIWGVNVESLHENFEFISKFPIDELTGLQYRGPVLFIGGNRSDFIKLSHLDEIKKVFPLSEIKMLDAGHNVHAENPSEFARLALNFLNRGD